MIIVVAIVIPDRAKVMPATASKRRPLTLCLPGTDARPIPTKVASHPVRSSHSRALHLARLRDAAWKITSWVTPSASANSPMNTFSLIVTDFIGEAAP